MLWFESLLFYGCEEREQEKDDVDVALLPTIVEKVILPKLTGRYQEGPCCTRFLRRASSLVSSDHFIVNVTESMLGIS